MIASDKTKRTRRGRPSGTRTKADHRRPTVIAQSSGEARRRAAAVLEVLSGVRTCAQAAEALGVSLPRYYLLEQRAVSGLVAACEPAPRGPQQSATRQIAALEREVARLAREVVRHQALARAAQRTLGLAPPAPARPHDKAGDKKAAGSKLRRRRRPTVRALQLAKELSAAAASEPTGGNLSVVNSSSGNSPSGVQQPAAS